MFLSPMGTGAALKDWRLPEYARNFDRPGVKTWVPTEDWSDCERHARNILGEEGFAGFQAKLGVEATLADRDGINRVAEQAPSYGTRIPGAQGNLFPDESPVSG